MKVFCELAEAITERFAQEMENLQDVFASYLHSNLRTFLNNSDVLHEAKLCFQNLQENDVEVNGFGQAISEVRGGGIGDGVCWLLFVIMGCGIWGVFFYGY